MPRAEDNLEIVDVEYSNSFIPLNRNNYQVGGDK